ncbi:MAG: hypothetical protein ABDI19_11560 [Armatimonadota bacterium]
MQCTGRTEEECVLEFLTRYCPRPAQGKAERQQALQRLMCHFGAQSCGKPIEIGNESIDADLQRGL